MSPVNNATNQQFAEMVQGGLRIGIAMASVAFQEGNAAFFEDCIVDQLAMRERAIYNYTNRVSFDEWLARANDLNTTLHMHKYDTSGELKRLNDTIFQNCAREYYERFVKAAYELPLDGILAQFDAQHESMKAMIGYIKAGLSTEDREVLGEITGVISEKIETATTEELVAVLKV